MAGNARPAAARREWVDRSRVHGAGGPDRPPRRARRTVKHRSTGLSAQDQPTSQPRIQTAVRTNQYEHHRPANSSMYADIERDTTSCEVMCVDPRCQHIAAIAFSSRPRPVHTLSLLLIAFSEHRKVTVTREPTSTAFTGHSGILFFPNDDGISLRDTIRSIR